MDIDDLLARSAPPRAERTPELREALRLLAVDVESQSRTPRRVRRGTLLAGATAAILGLGAAGAAAGDFLPRWVPWTTDQGSTCTIQFRVKPFLTPEEHLEYPHFGEDEYPAFDVSEDEYPHLSQGKVEAIQEALRFLATFDVDSIDYAQAIRDYQREEDAAIASMPPAEQQPRLTGDDLSEAAVHYEVSKELADHLASMGLPTNALGLHQLSMCP